MQSVSNVAQVQIARPCLTALMRTAVLAAFLNFLLDADMFFKSSESPQTSSSFTGLFFNDLENPHMELNEATVFLRSFSQALDRLLAAFLKMIVRKQWPH